MSHHIVGDTYAPHTPGNRLLGVFVALCALLVLITTLAGAGPASSETPAERCARETSAYNAAWAASWAATNPGQSPANAPPPPVPYVCVEPQDPTTTPTSPTTTAPGLPQATDTGTGPQVGAHAPTDIPPPGPTPIVTTTAPAVPTDTSRQAPITRSAAPIDPPNAELAVVPFPDPSAARFGRDLGRTYANDRIDSLMGSAEAYANCVYNVGLGAGERDNFDLESWSRKYGHVCERAEVGATNAESVAEDIYHDNKDHLDGKEDAMRHCTWHAFMAQDTQVGPQNARIVGRVYEMMGANDADSAQMDKFNNEFGVRLFETGRADTAIEAVESCRSAVDSGDLIVLNP